MAQGRRAFSGAVLGVEGPSDGLVAPSPSSLAFLLGGDSLRASLGDAVPYNVTDARTHGRDVKQGLRHMIKRARALPLSGKVVY